MSGKGLLVKNVQQGAVAAKAGIMVGDVIVSYAGLPVSNMDDIRTAVTQHILSTSPVDVVLHPASSPAEKRIVQCPPGSLSATLIPWLAEKGKDSAHMPKSFSQADSDDSHKSALPDAVSVMAYILGLLGLICGIWIIVTMVLWISPIPSTRKQIPFGFRLVLV